MYKKLVTNDLFNISNRIKHIDKNYYILFNTKNNKFEVHLKGQIGGTYCLTSPYKTLDARLLTYVVNTSLIHNKHLIEDIESANRAIDNEYKSMQENYARTAFNDIYKLCNDSTKNYDLTKIYNTKWV